MATSEPPPCRGSSRKRESSVEAEAAAPTRRPRTTRSRSPPPSSPPHEQQQPVLPASYREAGIDISSDDGVAAPEADGPSGRGDDGVSSDRVPAPEADADAAAADDTGSPKGEPSSSDDDEAAVAELGIKLFPSLSRDDAADAWVCFVRNAKTCIKHYNKKHQANFVYKHALGNGSNYVEEHDGSTYYHLNFMAQDKKGHSQLFFGEIKVVVVPKEEDVTCCCPVSPSDAGGKSIRNITEAVKYATEALKYANPLEKVGMDQEHCYACPKIFKHPEGTRYRGGHYADPLDYYML